MLMMVPADQPTLSATLKGCVSVAVVMYRKEQAVPLVDVSECKVTLFDPRSALCIYRGSCMSAPLVADIEGLT